ncbi:hypothetical protein IRZ71_04155 [Flavobacterium sp. ANB]|uniref:hypothetical protein n=1 Tax=unclassified Flavobacterium TaxID=196869 RepID=UPI0012B7D36E|nr:MULTISPECIES: hypothetical protein [unclassified Flavobacterium]MBF4515518.1 hypothetical protein [Flavobacterium sp. ANB]MTD68521.1 hypothetical protein [Flavobacterium sp. LC2016-13]
MKHLNIYVLVLIIFIALVSINCDHCDDEDVNHRDKNLTIVTKHTDSLEID